MILFLRLCLYFSASKPLSLRFCLYIYVYTFCLYDSVSTPLSTPLSLRLFFNVLSEIFTCAKCAISWPYTDMRNLKVVSPFWISPQNCADIKLQIKTEILQYLAHSRRWKDSEELYISMSLSQHFCLDVSVFTSQSLRICLHVPVPTHLSPRLRLNVSVSTYLFPHMRRFTSTVPARGAQASNRAISNSRLWY